MKCLICNKEISNKHFPQHLKKYHSYRPEDYTLKYLLNNQCPLCGCGCGQTTKYIKGKYKFNEFIHNHHRPTLNTKMSSETKEKISHKAKVRVSQLSSMERKQLIQPARLKAKQVNLKKYGVENPFNSPEVQKEIRETIKNKTSQEKQQIKSKIKQTNLEKHGHEHVFQVPQVKDKIKQTNMKKYGTEFSVQNKTIKEKIKQANLKKYNNICSLHGINQEKTENIFLQRYGVENPLQSKEIKDKIKQTNLEKYGHEHVFRSPQVKDKIEQTNLKKYGYKCPSKNTLIKEKIALKHRLSFEEIAKRCEQKKYIPLFTDKEYHGNRKELTFKCVKHNNTFSSCIFNISSDHHNCPECKIIGTSQFEQELVDFIQQFYSGNIERNVRNIITPKELDIYIPEKRMAIEFHGLYWHCELNQDKKNHYQKYLLCKKNNIDLLQIYEDEWRDKKEIWKSIIRHKLGTTKNKYNARDLLLQEDPELKTIKQFIDHNHLQGYCQSKKKFVLVNKEKEIVFCVTLRKPFTKSKDNVLEIARVCSRQDCIVRGGFSKIMKYAFKWAKENDYKKILTYSDCRYSDGKTYNKYGFLSTGHTGVGYDYTDFNNRYGRFMFRAQNGLTEREIAEKNNIFKIFNAGNDVWEYLL